MHHETLNPHKFNPRVKVNNNKGMKVEETENRMENILLLETANSIRIGEYLFHNQFE